MTAIALRLIAFACIAAALPCAQGADTAASGSRAGLPGVPPAGQAPAVKVENAWARATVAGQSSSAAYMVLTADAAQTLIAAHMDVAGLTELHEMALQGDVMRMRPLPDGLPLVAGQAVALKPGGQHIMLMKLKRPLQAGEVLPLTLTFRGADGRLRTQQVPVTVQRSAPAGVGGMGHMDGRMDGQMDGQMGGHMGGHDMPAGHGHRRGW